MSNVEKGLMASRYREFARDAARLAILNPQNAATHHKEARDFNAIANSFQTTAEAFRLRNLACKDA